MARIGASMLDQHPHQRLGSVHAGRAVIASNATLKTLPRKVPAFAPASRGTDRQRKQIEGGAGPLFVCSQKRDP